MLQQRMNPLDFDTSDAFDLFNEIKIKVDQTVALITSALNLHLNVDQTLLLNTSEVIFSVEKVSTESLSNKQIDSMRVSFSSAVKLHQPVSIRVCLEHMFSEMMILVLLGNDGTTCTKRQFDLHKFFEICVTVTS